MNEYIKDYGIVSEDDIYNLAERYLSDNCIVYAMHSDHFFCGLSLDIDIPHLMEMRIFNDDSELKICRYSLGNQFRWRYINDNDFRNWLSEEKDDFLSDFNNMTFDEVSYLDIVEKSGAEKSDTEYCTTGGGKYNLPVKKAERIKIRNYLDYDENGIAFISDFRIVKILKEGEK